jgi:UDP-N-acetylmuramate-alanine ligase
MKKFLAIAILAFTLGAAHAMTVDDVINAFPDASNVEKVFIDKDMLKIAGDNMPSELKDIEAVQVINIKKPTTKQFNTAKQLQCTLIDGMELILDASEKNQNVAIFSSNEKESISKLLIIVADERDRNPEVAVVLVKGKLNVDAIGQIVSLAQKRAE